MLSFALTPIPFKVANAVIARVGRGCRIVILCLPAYPQVSYRRIFRKKFFTIITAMDPAEFISTIGVPSIDAFGHQ